MIEKYKDLNNLKRLFISEKITLSEAIDKLNEEASQILLVVGDDNGVLKGTLTDGDIRRILSKGKPLSQTIHNMYCNTPKFQTDFSLDNARYLMEKHSVSRIPVLNEKDQPIGIIGIEDISSLSSTNKPKENVIVIMAGGKGTRLHPITKVIPKPLLPIKDKPIVQLIMDSFQKYGFNNFIMSVNYKKEYIKTYFSDETEHGYTLSFIEEEEFLGTAGSLKLMDNLMTDTFFVSNCDILIEMDYAKVLEFHKKQHADLTIIGALSEIQVPYGVLETEGNTLSHISEKPQFHFMVNTGVYILEPSVLEFIPEKGSFDMPDLIKKLMDDNRKVIVYPTHEKWVDIGTFGTYNKLFD